MASILFVCTGNTCRSPLAEAMTRLEAEKRDVDVTVSSAGTFAAGGAVATPQSARAAARRGADLAAHRARPLDRDMLAVADVVLAMTSAQVRTLRIEHGRELDVALVTDYLPPDHPRHGASVSDPFGGSDEEYEAVARLLEVCIPYILDRLSEPG